MALIKKRTIIILGSICLLILVLGVLHFTSSSHTDISITKRSIKVVPLSTAQIIAPAINRKNGVVQYYEKGTGKTYEVRPDGTELRAISGRLPDLLSSIWSRDAQAVISSFSTTEGLQFRTYKFATKESITLPRGTQSVSFSPDGTQIAFFRTEKSGSESGIFVMGSDGKGTHQIMGTRATNGEIFWPNDQFISFTIWQPAQSKADVFIVDLDGGISHFLDEQQEFEQLWPRSGKKVLFSLKNSYNETELWVHDFETGAFSILPLSAKASRCAWATSEKAVICAVATKSSANAPDVFFNIDLTTGTTQKLSQDVDQRSRFVVEQLLLWPDESTLIVLNRSDGKLYSLSFSDGE